ncbi:MAG: MFS transporter [Gemmatimonadetes bacterium]|nr:MAG: MFS transporter [Gemmatimonadota bacterium]
MALAHERLSVGEKVGYGIGDAAANFIFQTMIIFQLAFYTDTFGITAAAAGTLFLVVRVFDAAFDPFMGVIADRTNTRWGKFRPWILWTALPFGIMGLLAFTTPDLTPAGKLAYAYVTYILLMMVYSANNLPYSALSGVMTGDVVERTSLSSYRMVAAMASQLVIQGLALPMVHRFGAGNDAQGYRITMGIFSALAVVFFLITFATTRERVRPDPAQKSSIRQDFADLLSNGPWKVMFALTIILFVTLALRGGVMVYFFKYYVGREDMFSLFNVIGTGATIIGVLLSKPVAERVGKRQLFIVGLLGTVVFTGAFILLPPTNLPLIITTEALRQFAYGFTIPLLWAMMADVADFSEWKNRRRATAVVFSAIIFGLKAGLGIGGAIGGYLLDAYGYVPNAVQSEHALLGIRLTASVYPAIAFLLCAVCLWFYRIDKSTELEMSTELTERRNAFQPSPVPSVP